MTYWLDLFTGTTWKEFKDAGSKITGFRASQSGQGHKVTPGDVFLCYLTGVQRWVGALEVIRSSKDKSPIWKTEDFPIRFEVKPLVTLDPEYGIPMASLLGRVSFFESSKEQGKFRGFVRRSPNRFLQPSDGEIILSLLKGAVSNPVYLEVDPKKLARKPLYKAEQRKGKFSVPTVVSVPEPEGSNGRGLDEDELTEETSVSTTRHTEIQYNLLRLGADMGLQVWVAKNDRSRKWKVEQLAKIPGMVFNLPTQFNEATNKTIELIDVLWLKGNSFVAAFEIECTTSVYSGLLRMSDLLALQPNLDIKLYLVAPDDRRSKVREEILRPTFKLREKPLSEVCGFLSFTQLMEKVDGIRKLGLASSLKPDFLEQAAEYFTQEK